MNSERRMRAVALAAWLAGGAALGSWETGPGEARSIESPEHSVFALLGSGRTLAADWFWLETNLAWERHDAAETRRLIALAVAADPNSRYFRINGARMLAYDLPVWVNEADPGAPGALRVQRHEQAAKEALELLQRGLDRHGSGAVFEIEMANICLYALDDSRRAAAFYERAAKRDDAPAYAARIAARLREEAER